MLRPFSGQSCLAAKSAIPVLGMRLPGPYRFVSEEFRLVDAENDVPVLHLLTGREVPRGSKCAEALLVQEKVRNERRKSRRPVLAHRHFRADEERSGHASFVQVIALNSRSST